MARNKAHKSRFSSKRETARKEQGRPAKGPKTTLGKHAKSQLTQKGGNGAGHKASKKQAAEAMRAKKVAIVQKEKTIGTRAGPPRILGLLPANESGSVPLLYKSLHDFCGTPGENRDMSRPTHMGLAVSKSRYTCVCDPEGDEQRSIDVAKVSDIVMLCLDVSQAVQQTLLDLRGELEKAELYEDEDAADDDDRMTMGTNTTWFSDVGLCITDATRELVQHINAQGSPTCIVVLQGLQTYDNPKRRRQAVKLHERYFADVLAQGSRVVAADTPAEMAALMRTLSTTKLRALKWREQRPYMVVDAARFDPESGELHVSGFLRGTNANASMLFHVTNHGTYQGVRVSAPGDPIAMRASKSTDPAGLLDEANAENQEGLEACQINADTMLLEDEGMPTEADVLFAEAQAKAEADKRGMVKAPAGTSEYQAAWFDEPDAPDAHRQPTAPVAGDDDEDAAERMSRRTNQTDIEYLKAADILRHDELTDEERRVEAEALREECEDEERHPDEVDCPWNVPARQRFQKYRGMKSFATSTWRVNENLPPEYARVFRLQGYGQIRDVALFEAGESVVEAGSYVSVTVSGFTEADWKAVDHSCLIVSAQLRHEQKWSVVHYHVQRCTDYEEPIKSKTPMLAHCGFRKFYCSPLFSDATVGDRTKFARYFLPHEKFRIASFFGPVSYHPCPILLFKAPSVQEIQDRSPPPLCAFGSAMAPSTDFLIMKRIVLTGRIAVIHKRQVVVKHMFNNEDDVKWFQPVELYTRLGRSGKILKAVGTHGLYKCSFNDTVMQHDRVCMALYKRVFPKWTTVMYDASEDAAAVRGSMEDVSED